MIKNNIKIKIKNTFKSKNKIAMFCIPVFVSSIIAPIAISITSNKQSVSVKEFSKNSMSVPYNLNYLLSDNAKKVPLSSSLSNSHLLSKQKKHTGKTFLSNDVADVLPGFDAILKNYADTLPIAIIGSSDTFGTIYDTIQKNGSWPANGKQALLNAREHDNEINQKEIDLNKEKSKRISKLATFKEEILENIRDSDHIIQKLFEKHKHIINSATKKVLEFAYNNAVKALADASDKLIMDNYAFDNKISLTSILIISGSLLFNIAALSYALVYFIKKMSRKNKIHRKY